MNSITTLLPTIDVGHGAPTLVMMHLFGSSKSEWAECVKMLSTANRCVVLDLPGFGEAGDITGYSIKEMVAALTQTLHACIDEEFVLIGHSMSGKVAMAFAAQKPAGLRGLVLVTPSPPSPEPIKDADRARMLSMSRDRASAETFLDGITAKPLAGNSRERAIKDFIHASPTAWRAWLECGSREDWSDRIGRFDLPTLVVAGSDDPSLSESVQQRTTMRHLDHGRLEVIPNCGHVPTLENPMALSFLIKDFLELNLYSQ